MRHRKFCGYERKAMSVIQKVIRGTLFTILGIAVAAFIGFVTMWLWNRLITDIFDLRSIKYFEAVGLFVLGKIFFGGFGGGGHDEPKRTVRREVGKEIDDEIEKEMNSEFEKQDIKENEEYEKAYEEWWQQKGEKSFNQFMSDKDS